MYVLTISVSDKYTIGDPRTQDVVMPDFGYQKYIWNRRWVDDGWYDNWAEGAWTENSSVTNHVLTYYHPASSENTSGMIAPNIRIASSYGVCQVGRTSEEGMLRCATYQEDGLPAGRWRLPTFAEASYMPKQASFGVVALLQDKWLINFYTGPIYAQVSHYGSD